MAGLSDKLFHLLHDLITQLPALVMIGACIVFCFLRGKRHPQVSRMVVIGLVLLFFHIIGFTVVYTFVPDLFAGLGEYQTRAIVQLIISLIYNLMLAAIFGVLLIAAFMQRSPTAPSTSTIAAR